MVDLDSLISNNKITSTQYNIKHLKFMSDNFLLDKLLNRFATLNIQN